MKLIIKGIMLHIFILGSNYASQFYHNYPKSNAWKTRDMASEAYASELLENCEDMISSLGCYAIRTKHTKKQTVNMYSQHTEYP